MLVATGQFVMFSDADLSAPIEQVERLIAFLEKGYDVAIASRGLSESGVQVPQHWWRQSMGRVFNFLAQKLLLPGIWDS